MAYIFFIISKAPYVNWKTKNVSTAMSLLENRKVMMSKKRTPYVNIGMRLWKV